MGNAIKNPESQRTDMKEGAENAYGSVFSVLEPCHCRRGRLRIFLPTSTGVSGRAPFSAPTYRPLLASGVGEGVSWRWKRLGVGVLLISYGRRCSSTTTNFRSQQQQHNEGERLQLPLRGAGGLGYERLRRLPSLTAVWVRDNAENTREAGAAPSHVGEGVDPSIR